MRQKKILGASILVALSAICVRSANASNSNFEIYKNLMRNGQFDEAGRVVRKIIEDEKDGESRSLALFGFGVLLQKQNKNEEAVAQFDAALNMKSDLMDFLHIHKGKSLRALQKYKEAREEFLKAEALPEKSTRAFYEAEFELGEIDMLEKKWAGAVAHFQKLERKLRSDEKYPAILLNLVKIENARTKKYNACKWARKLYSKYPHDAVTQTWSIDLQNVIVDEKPLQCVATLADQKSRIRNLQLQGQSEKAKAEIAVLRARSSDGPSVHVDMLTAQFFISEGQPQEAQQILMPYYKKDNLRDFNLVVLLGRTAALAGEFQTAVASYERAHKLSPKSRAGRATLFQAAFLSYQFQDYDGAAKKFEDFIKKFPKSGLSTDAKWHLAWIKYLKGDYQAAYDAFKSQWKSSTRKRRATTSEKTLYWTAMSLVKLNRNSEAVPIFEQVSQDKTFGYYSLAAKSRLQILKASEVRQTAGAKSVGEKVDIPENAQVVTVNEESEGEDDEKTLQSMESSESDEETAEAKEEGEEVAPVGAVPESPFQNSKMAMRFKRANDLISIGLYHWATWELYEIERRTAQHQHLRTLISRYESIEAFNRSSFISHVYFSRQRGQGGLHSEQKAPIHQVGLPLWHAAYPRAFERSVTNFGRAFGVPDEFIWGIMRAESQFKADVKSPVGALGLMQLMPYTASQVAKMIDFDQFTTPQLFEPATNIRLGTRYLQRLLKQFDQSIPLSAASYNAGPHRVRGWLKNFGSKLDMDEFVEHIPYVETRNYVKKVVHNYYIYRQLYNKSAKSDELLSFLAKPVGIKITGDVESRERWD